MNGTLLTLSGLSFFLLVKRHELSDCPPEVVSLISHAVQERLKTLVERLGTIAEHRQEQFKVVVLSCPSRDCVVLTVPPWIACRIMTTTWSFKT